MTHAGARSTPARLQLAETRSGDISDLTRRTRATRGYSASLRDAPRRCTSRYPPAYRTVKIKPPYCEQNCLDVTHTLALIFVRSSVTFAHLDWNPEWPECRYTSRSHDSDYGAASRRFLLSNPLLPALHACARHWTDWTTLDTAPANQLFSFSRVCVQQCLTPLLGSLGTWSFLVVPACLHLAILAQTARECHSSKHYLC